MREAIQKVSGRLRGFAKAQLSPNALHLLRTLSGRHSPPPVGSVNLGDLGTAVPVSLDFGHDRGSPIDRYYIEGFLRRNQADIRGRVLEVGDDEYSRKYGGARVQRQDILHAHAGNPAATVVGDFSDDTLLEPATYDCLVVTQTLHLVYDMKAALKTMHGALAPGGTLLLTVPGISPIDRGEWGKSWYWSLTRIAAERLVGEVFGATNTRVEAHGNIFAATAFLQGLAQEEIDCRKLDLVDDAFPVIVAVRARK